MSFDINQTAQDMLKAASAILSDDWPAIESCVKKALQEQKDALADIANARIKNEINDEDVQSQLDDEKLALQAAMLACQVQAKVAVQKAANAAIDVLGQAIKAAL